MPLSKTRNRDRMRQSRLHARQLNGIVQLKGSPQRVLDAMGASPHLSKEDTEELMLHLGCTASLVQPKTAKIEGKDYIIPELDADGNRIYED